MNIATTYVQVPPTELSGVLGMATVPGAGWGEQPSNYTYPTTTWPAPVTDQWDWGPPPVDPQNYSYSGGGMTPAVAVYPTGSVPLAAPIPIPAYPPPSPGGPFDARNYMPPDSAFAPYDARNYVPPDSTPMQSTYEPRTSESAFNNSMQLYGGGVTSPVIPPASYLLSPQISRSSSGGSYPHSSASGLSRSASTKERGAWLYDRPGSWRPRFQMPRSGVSSLVPSFTRGRSFPPVDTTARTLDERLRFSALREPPILWDMREAFTRVLFRELKRQVTGYDLTRFTTEPPTPYMKLFHARLPWYIEVSASNEVGVTFLRFAHANPGRALVAHQEFGFLQ